MCCNALFLSATILRLTAIGLHLLLPLPQTLSLVLEHLLNSTILSEESCGLTLCALSWQHLLLPASRQRLASHGWPDDCALATVAGLSRWLTAITPWGPLACPIVPRYVAVGRGVSFVPRYLGKLLPRVSCTTRPVERSVYEGVLRYPFAQKLRLQNSYVVEV